MKRKVGLALSLIVLGSSHAAAQDLEFTLDEVEAADAPPKAKKGAPAAQSVDAGPAIRQTLGHIRWGMSKADLVQVLKAEIRTEFEQRIKVERDIMRQDQLYQQANERARRLTESYVEFDGQKTGWDVSPVRAEFTHGNRETMLVVAQRNSRDMYFFIQGKLWKWYRELSPQALEVDDASAALDALKERFGSGKPQQERKSDSEEAYAGATWSDGTTRVTAMQRGGDACLILEDQRVLDQLAVLRHNVQPKSGKRGAAAVIDSILLSGAELEARNR